MSKKYNQFIQNKMKEFQPDLVKLIKIASYLRKHYLLKVIREPILLFDKNDGSFVACTDWITKAEFYKYTKHRPDLVFYVKSKMWIMEIDGPIHNTNTTVALKDIERNECYRAANMNLVIINEWEAMLKRDISPNRSATFDELVPEIKRRMSRILAPKVC